MYFFCYRFTLVNIDNIGITNHYKREKLGFLDNYRVNIVN